LLPGLLAGRWKRILFCPTGALHSPTATMQGESIPGICHAIALEGGTV
ncbi:MAG: stage V sporulation protein AD, partial [Clostridiales bacterium]|nr:stage V sporulation protein AD [Clostridiales bacterium]